MISPMSIWVYIILGACALVGIAIFFFAGRKGGDPSTYELGQISDQWISQHRAHLRDSDR